MSLGLGGGRKSKLNERTVLSEFQGIWNHSFQEGGPPFYFMMMFEKKIPEKKILNFSKIALFFI